MKKSLLYGTLALAVAGGVAAASAALTNPAKIAAAADSSGSAAATAQDHRAGHGPFGGALNTVAQLLQITPQELLQDLRQGQTIAQVAQSKGVSEQQVIDAIVKDMSAAIDKRVQDGKLTQDQADKIKAGLADKAKKMVEHQGPWKKEGHPFRGGFLKDIASILGMSQQDLLNELKSGKSIAQVAQSKGVSESQLVDQLLQKERDVLTKLVERQWGSHKDSGTDGQSGSDQNSGSGAANESAGSTGL